MESSQFFSLWRYRVVPRLLVLYCYNSSSLKNQKNNCSTGSKIIIINCFNSAEMGYGRQRITSDNSIIPSHQPQDRNLIIMCLREHSVDVQTANKLKNPDSSESLLESSTRDFSDVKDFTDRQLS